MKCVAGVRPRYPVGADDASKSGDEHAELDRWPLWLAFLPDDLGQPIDRHGGASGGGGEP